MKTYGMVIQRIVIRNKRLAEKIGRRVLVEQELEFLTPPDEFSSTSIARLLLDEERKFLEKHIRVETTRIKS